jgi:Ni/Fe-hydrogenase subunit HybB-like protein
MVIATCANDERRRGGITSTYGATYSPHWIEVAITAGIVSAGVLTYLVVCSNFPVFVAHRRRSAAPAPAAGHPAHA